MITFESSQLSPNSQKHQKLYDDPRRSKACSITESTTIQSDFTPCRGVPFYPHDTGTMQLMQVYGLHKGVPVTTLPNCATTFCQAPNSAETTPSPRPDTPGAASNH